MNTNGMHASHQTIRLTETQIVDWLKASQKLAVDFCHEQFTVFARALDARLEALINDAPTNKEQTRLIEIQRGLQNSRDDFEGYFCGYLGECFIKFKKKELCTHTGEEKFEGDMLTLVDNQDLEETIAISSITRRAEANFGESIWALNQRFAILNGGEKVDETNNPLSPVQFCVALRKALKILAFDTKAKLTAYKVFDTDFIVNLGEVFRDTNNFLVEQGILPNLDYSVSGEQAPPMPLVEEYETEFRTDGSAPREIKMPGPIRAPDAGVPTGQYQGRLMDAIRVLQNHMGARAPQHGEAGEVGVESLVARLAGNAPQQGGAAAPGGAAGGYQGVLYSNQQLVGALQNLQTQALSLTADSQMVDGDFLNLQPQQIADVSIQLANQLRQESDDGAVDPSDMHTIDLVGMLFEYMLSDDNLPNSVKALLSYLHTPFLKVAFIDKDFFEQSEHPARLLLNNLAEAGARWVSNDGTSQYDIYTKIKDVVSRVLESFKNDVRLFAELLLEFSSYTKKLTRRQDLMEKRALEKVQGEEKLREVKIQVNEEVRKRTDGRELPSAVLLLLLQPWSDYLAFLLLRYGEKSESWGKALGVVDQILWSIEPKEEAKEKARQVEMHDELIDTIEMGFETIGYDQAKGGKLIEALVSLQKLALQSRKAEPAPEAMREKLESLATEKAGGMVNTTEATPEENKMVENLKMIEFGTWFEFEGGKRLKVAWYNSKTLHYMLVDQMGKKVAMKSGLELAREMIAGNAKVIAGSTKPFFERALENIFQSLNAKAENIAETETSDEAGELRE